MTLGSEAVREDHEEGLIKIYLDELKSLAVKAEYGESVMDKAEDCIRRAEQHFSKVVTSNKEDNLKVMRGRLTLMAENHHESQPTSREVFRQARDMVSRYIEADE